MPRWPTKQVVALAPLVLLLILLSTNGSTAESPKQGIHKHNNNRHISQQQQQQQTGKSSSNEEVKPVSDKPHLSSSRKLEGRDHGERQIEGRLVRQLSDLIMNNEPAVIQQKLASEQIEGQLEEETNRLVRLASSGHAAPFRLTRRPSRAERATATAATTTTTSGRAESPFDESALEELDLLEEDDRVEFGARERSTGGGRSEKRRRHMALAAASWSDGASDTDEQSSQDSPAGTADPAFLQDQLQGQLEEEQQQQQQQQTVTCSPDYEDQTILIDQDSAQLSEFLGGAGLSSGNLTAEQRQQLLNGADLSGLLLPPSPSNLSQQQQQQPHPGQPLSIGQCVPAGSRMIEVITKVITPILFTIIIIVGLLGNIIVMLVILEDRQVERELTPTNLLILDLSLADLSFIVLCIPFTGWDYAVGHWVFGSLWCKFNQYLIVVCALSSIYTLVLMSCDRFMAIVYPIECISYRTSANMLHAIVVKWIVILLVASPTIFMHGLVDSPLGPDQYNCRFLSDHFNPLHFQFIFFITSYFLPLVLIFFLYLSLLRRLWCGRRPRGHKESHKMLESKKKVTWLVASIVLVFAACWFPIQIMLILMRLKTHKITATYVAVQVFAHTLGYMNSCVNPIVYAFASDTFNQSFKKSRLGRLCMAYLCCQRAQLVANNQNHNNNNNNHRHHSLSTNGHNYNHNHHQSNLQATTTTNHQPLGQRLASTTTLVGGGGGGGAPPGTRRPGAGGALGAASRNSLQIEPGTTTTRAANGEGLAGGEQARGTNKSMGNIFAQPRAPGETGTAAAPDEGGHLLERAAQHHALPAPQPLALEPRDRPQLVKGPSAAMVARQRTQNARMGASASASQLDGTQPPQGSSPPQLPRVAKQQLVARMVAASGPGGSCGQIVSHDCSPSERSLADCEAGQVDLNHRAAD